MLTPAVFFHGVRFKLAATKRESGFGERAAAEKETENARERGHIIREPFREVFHGYDTTGGFAEDEVQPGFIEQRRQRFRGKIK